MTVSPGKIEAVVLDSVRSFRGRHRLEPAPGLTVIVGPSDAGKSNLARAIAGIVYNEPAAEMIHREDKRGQTIIEFTGPPHRFKRGPGVSLCKDQDGKNEYRLQAERELADGTPGPYRSFEKVGREVPADIAAAIGLGDVDLGGERVNLHLQTQRGGAFVIDDPPARVAKIVGAAAGLEVVFRAVKQAEGEAREAAGLAKAARALAEEATGSLRVARTAQDGPGLSRAAREAREAAGAADAILGQRDALAAARARYGAAARGYRSAKTIAAGAADRLRGANTACAAARIQVAARAPLAAAVLRLSRAATTLRASAAAAKQAGIDARAAADRVAAFWEANPVCPLCGGPKERA